MVEKKLSIIIPTFNSAKYIGECLESLKKLDYEKSFSEILVIDGDSKDETADVAKQKGATVYGSATRIIAAQRNFGAGMAKGDIFAFIDSDCVAPVNWLKVAIELLKREDVGAVGAEYALPNDVSWIEKTWDNNIEKCNGEVDWLPSGNLIVKREAFEKIGGFREDLITSEDVDFCERLRKAGYKIVSDNRLSVVHLGNPKTVKEFFIKEVWRGKGVVQRFFSNMPNIKITKALGYSLFILCVLISLFFGAIQGFLFNSWFLFNFSLIIILLVPLFIATIKALKVHRAVSIFKLGYLYLIYGIARAVNLLDYRNWKRV